jgi:type I restriction enzyme S subunit
MRDIKYVSFEEAYETVSVGKAKIHTRDYLPEGSYPIIDQGQATIAGFTNNASFVRQDERPIIVFGDHTRVVKYLDFPFAVGADGVRLFRAKAGYDTEYLYFFLQSARIPNDGYGRHSKYLNDLLIPRVYITEQRRVAARLKTQLGAVEEARSAAEAQLRELTQLADAVVSQSIAHPDTNETRLGDVLEEVKQGIGPTWNEYPVLGATRAGLALAKEPVGKSPERYKPVFPGTVFYNPMRIMIGSIAMVDEGDAPGITSPDYVALRGKRDKVDSRWFYYWLRSSHGKHCIASLARGAVRERMLFNRLAEGNIDLPKYEVQQLASQQLAQIKPMRKAVEDQLADIERLPSRLLAQAFGEIGHE